MTPGRFQVNFRCAIFKLILVVNGWGICCETALIWMSLDHTYDKSTLVQVIAWCRQATIHCPSQCWPRSLAPYGIARPQRVNPIWLRDSPDCHTCLIHITSQWYVAIYLILPINLLPQVLPLINSLCSNDTIWQHKPGPDGTKPLPEPLLTNYQ